MLKTSGFKVVDLGIDVPTFTFLEEAQKNKADIIGLSALLTTTMTVQQGIIEAIESQGLGEEYRGIVGGGPVNQEWAI